MALVGSEVFGGACYAGVAGGAVVALSVGKNPLDVARSRVMRGVERVVELPEGRWNISAAQAWVFPAPQCGTN